MNRVFLRCAFVFICFLYASLCFAASADCKKAIAHFAREFHMTTSHAQLPVRAYRRFLNQLAATDFGLDSPTIKLGRIFRKRTVTLHPELVEGWRRLGFIKDDRWNWALSMGDFLENASRETGLRFAWSADADLEFQPHSEFIYEILRDEFVGVEMHDALFHAPWLTHSFNRSMFRLAARFDVVRGVVRDARLSPLTPMFEFDNTYEYEKYLMGGFQIFPIEIARRFGKPSQWPSPAVTWQHIQKWRQNPKDWSYERGPHGYFMIDQMRALPDTRLSWLLTLSMMELELDYKYQNADPFDPLETKLIQELLSDVRLERQKLEADESLIRQLQLPQ